MTSIARSSISRSTPHHIGTAGAHLRGIAQEQPLPLVLRTDNGPEFLGEAFVQWANAHGMAIQYIQPGKPNQNAYI
jgi:transposase InsO family protein